MIAAFCLSVSIANAQQFAGGNGTVGNPYLISTAEQLNNIRYPLLGQHFRLINDIDLGVFLSDSTAGWLPIGEFRVIGGGSGYPDYA